MIIDCFTFFNELELLELRLEELRDAVDCFLLVEALETYSGKPKEALFEKHRDRFGNYRINVIQIPSFPEALESSYQREEYTRNALEEGLLQMGAGPADIVLLSDLDEIPRSEAVSEYSGRLQREGASICYLFEQALYYYYLNCRVSQNWCGTRMIRYGNLSTFHELRSRGGEVIPNGGWHFSYLGGPDRIRQKIAASIHVELDLPEFTDRTHIEQCLSEARDLFGREMGLHFVPIDDSFPRYVREHREKFGAFIDPRGERPDARTLFLNARRRSTDINEHLEFLYRLASTVTHITELGTGTGQSTCAFLYAAPEWLITYDTERQPCVRILQQAAEQAGVRFEARQQDSREAEIEPTDLLFIDTWHVEEQMSEELRLHGNKARRYLVLHDTETFGHRGEAEGHRGIWYAISDFVRENPHWRLLHHFPHNNGLTVFTRVE